MVSNLWGNGKMWSWVQYNAICLECSYENGGSGCGSTWILGIGLYEWTLVFGAEGECRVA